jgi:outer membrane beta-barrel protein
MRMKLKLFSLLFFVVAVFSLNPINSVHAGEKDVYEFSWLDPDKEVFVLQNRKYRKADKVFVNLGAGVTTSGAFVDATSIQGRLGYFFAEDYGFEVLYAKNSGEENDTAKGVRTSGGGGTGTTPFRRIVQNYLGGMLLWSPFYSKINTFNSIVYMDWIFGLGYAQLTEKNNKLRFTQGQIAEGVETEETHSGIMWEAGLKFYVSESVSIRTDLTAIHYSADNISTTGSSYKSNFDATVSLGYSF